MQIVIDIPDEDIPKRQDMLIVDIAFIHGQVSHCDYPFEELPKGHGRLIDVDALINKCAYDLDNNFVIDLIDVREAPTIIEADKGGKKNANSN